MTKTTLIIPDAIRQHLPADAFGTMMQFQGKVFRDVSGRKTLQIKIDGRSYFIKQHFGVGWSEIFKNLINFKKPILGAMVEVAAIQKMNAIGIPTTPLVAYGERGLNPAARESFVLTEDLGDIISLEDLASSWQHQSAKMKHALIVAVAELATKLHGAGLCHRDFYLCHIMAKKIDLEQQYVHLYLIDLHRVLHYQASDSVAIMKDIAGLFFSAQQYAWSDEDLTLFKQHYLPQTAKFWVQVDLRAQKLRRKFNSEKFQARLAADKAKL